jgi:hypothetical protein
LIFDRSIFSKQPNIGTVFLPTVLCPSLFWRVFLYASLSHCCQGCHPPLSRIVLLLIQGLYGTLFGKTSVMTLSAILSFIIGMGGGRDRDLWIREKRKKPSTGTMETTWQGE